MPEDPLFGVNEPADDASDEEQASDGEEEGSEEEQPTDEQDEDAEEVPEPDEETLKDFKGDKDKYVKSYKEVRKAFVQSRQENSQLAERLARLEGKLEGMSESKKSAAQETASEEEDPEEWVSQNLYAKGPQAIDERVRKVLSEESAKQRDTQDQYNQEALRLSQKYDDFGDLVPDMKRVYNENPELAVIPGGMEKAYKLAKAERVTSEEAKAAKKAAKEKSTALKAAARMPAASTRTGRETKPTPEDEIRKRTFGTQDTQRVFG